LSEGDLTPPRLQLLEALGVAADEALVAFFQRNDRLIRRELGILDRGGPHDGGLPERDTQRAAARSAEQFPSAELDGHALGPRCISPAGDS
jgi:hypothetical protein